MKSIHALVFLVFIPFISYSQQDNLPTSRDYGFEITVDNDATSVKNQQRSGTCWCFSTVSFLESEMIRMGKDPVDLSELYVVKGIYREKAENYILRQGESTFSQGALAHDVIHAYEKYGMVPQEVYDGLPEGMDAIDHTEMTAALSGMVKGIVDNKGGIYWRQATDALLDVYMGEVPSSFTFEGKKYTPRSFADEVVGIDAANYVELTSFTHIPPYRKFVLEVPDNFSSGSYYNLPLDEMVEVVKSALKDGYTVVWDCDVSEPSFNARQGYAIMPKPDAQMGEGDLPMEISVTPEMRQQAYETYKTTDDHLMHITGIAKDKNGKEYFVVKNSWGEVGPFEGYLYASFPYFKMKTVGIMIHKNGIPASISKKIFNK